MYLEQKAVARFLLNCSLDTNGVRDGQIVANDLNINIGSEMGPSIPVVFREGILNEDDRVLLDVAQIQVCELFSSNLLAGVRVRVLEVQVVLLVLEEL